MFPSVLSVFGIPVWLVGICPYTRILPYCLNQSNLVHDPAETQSGPQTQIKKTPVCCFQSVATATWIELDINQAVGHGAVQRNTFWCPQYEKLTCCGILWTSGRTLVHLYWFDPIFKNTFEKKKKKPLKTKYHMIAQLKSHDSVLTLSQLNGRLLFFTNSTYFYTIFNTATGTKKNT